MFEEKKIKAFSFAVKDLDNKKGVVIFYGSAFGTTKADADSDNDVILKGAFTKTIKENFPRIKHCLNHSVYDVPGVFTDLKEDPFGLLCTSQLAKSSDNTFSTLAKDTLINYEAGVITEHSIGYRPTKEAYDQQEDCNFISEIKLWEVSSLTGWGANSNTPVVGVKSQKDCLEQLKAIDKVIHNTSISDEGAKNLLKISEQINTYLKSILKKEADAITSNSSVDYKFLTKNFN